MSRFYDRLLRASRRGKHTPLADPEFMAYAREDAADLPETTVIAVDNVSQYFYEVSGIDEWRCRLPFIRSATQFFVHQSFSSCSAIVQHTFFASLGSGSPGGR